MDISDSSGLAKTWTKLFFEMNANSSNMIHVFEVDYPIISGQTSGNLEFLVAVDEKSGTKC